MTKHIMFPPVHNGLDYLKNVIEHLRDEPDQRDLKYAVLHLYAAVEVLLKGRLIREHWSLVSEDLNTASRSAFASGDFKSITLKGTLARLDKIAGVEIPRPAQDQFLRLAKQRHRLQHFGMEEQATAIEALAGQVLNALLCFIRDHLRPGADLEDEHLLDETQKLASKEITRIKALVAARRDQIKPGLDERAGFVVHCPSCQCFTLPIDALPCRSTRICSAGSASAPGRSATPPHPSMRAPCSASPGTRAPVDHPTTRFTHAGTVDPRPWYRVPRC